jgi:hypothetical protein
MTLGDLEDKLATLGYGNFQFQLVAPDEVEAMVELEDGQVMGVIGRNLTEATEGLLSKLEQFDKVRY